MTGFCAGRVVVVTGAGNGLGRAHALAFAAAGAAVVVNDLGVSREGDGGGAAPAQQVVAEIEAAGGTAVANTDDIADFDGAGNLIATTVRHFGRVDTVVNNAGFLRDRMLATMSVDEWDAVVRVHLRGHFCVLRHALDGWRAAAKAGSPPSARVVNTSSGAGLMGSIGQGNYAAAKAGIAALTIQAAAECARYGVAVNAIAPSARTRMTEVAMPDLMRRPASGFDAMDPANVSPLVVWLGSAACDVTGRVFEIEGGAVSVATGWQHGPSRDKGARWSPEELGPVVSDLLAEAPAPAPVYGA